MGLKALSLSFLLFGAPALACQPSNEASKAVLDATNALRAAKSIGPLSLSDDLTRAAQAHACEMAKRGVMTHEGANGSSVRDRVRATGYAWRFVAENVAYGYNSPPDVVSGWEGSRGHRRNMLSRDAEDIGVGVWEAGGRLYWAMVLGRR